MTNPELERQLSFQLEEIKEAGEMGEFLNNNNNENGNRASTTPDVSENRMWIEFQVLLNATTNLLNYLFTNCILHEDDKDSNNIYYWLLPDIMSCPFY